MIDAIRSYPLILYEVVAISVRADHHLQTLFRRQVKIQMEKVLMLCDEEKRASKVVKSRGGTRSALESEFMCSSAIKNGPGTSEEESVCFQSTAAFRPWSN